MKKILCMGEAFMTCYTKDEGELKEASNFKLITDGAAFNVACGIGKLNGQVTLVSKLAKDLYGQRLKKELIEANVDIDNLVFDGAFQTSFLFKNDREKAFYRQNAAYLNLSWKELYPDLLDEVEIVHFSSACLNSSTKVAHQMILQNAFDQHKIISFDPRLEYASIEDERKFRELLFEFLNYVSILKLNEEELYFLTASSSITGGMNYLFQRFENLKVILYTKTYQGANAYFKDHSMVQVKALENISYVDDFVKEDAFMAGFLVTLSRFKEIDLNNKKDIYTSLCAASAYADLSLEKEGGASSLMNLRAFREALKNH